MYDEVGAINYFMNRERLTITVRNDLLKLVDGVVDGEKIRNRSHAIEYLLSKALDVQGGTKVLILAGGKPIYLESQKKTLPKAMVKIAGRPLLEQTLERLKAAKLTEIYISLGEGGKSIQEYFGDGSTWGLTIHYLQQKFATGTAQPLMEAKQYLNGTFLLLYGDVLSDIDFGDLMEFHKKQPAVCTMALSSVETVSMWGLAKLQGNRIVAFEEKPQNPKTFSRLINAGIYVMQPEIFNLISSKTAKLEREVFPRLAEEGKLYGYPYECLWLDISSSVGKKKK